MFEHDKDGHISTKELSHVRELSYYFVRYHCNGMHWCDHHHSDPKKSSCQNTVRNCLTLLKMCKSLSSINDWQVMFNMGEDVSEEKAKEKIREADLDGDGRVAVIFQENLCSHPCMVSHHLDRWVAVVLTSIIIICHKCELHSF